jgi:polysaccharide export outer membrane protein
MTKACIFRRGKGNWIASYFTMIIFLYLVCGCAAFGSEAPNMQQEAASLSNGSVQEAKGDEFILGPGDTLAITLYRHDDLAKTVQIDHSGQIVFPLVGEIQAGGLSVSQLRNTIQAALAKYLVDPEVFITVTSVRSQNVIILGEVDSPGLFSLDVPRSCLQMIATAGGFTKNAKLETVLLIRGGFKKSELITLNFKKVFKSQDLSQNIPLRNGDIIYVPATRIENVSLYFDHLQRILATFYQAILGGIITTSAGK